MKYFKPLWLCLFFGLCATANAQKKDTLVSYFDSGFAATSKQKAMYVRIAYYQKSVWFGTVKKIANNSKVMEGTYTGKALDVPEGVFNYYDNNFLTATGLFHDGVMVGVWKHWNHDHLLSDSAFYNNYGEVQNETKLYYHPNGLLWRYSFENDRGMKDSKAYDSIGNVISEGHFVNSDGETIFYYPSGKVKSRSVFKNGERIVNDFFDEDGKKYSEKEYRDLGGRGK